MLTVLEFGYNANHGVTHILESTVMIKPVPTTIEGLLATSQKFEVPEYQRDFAWGKDEALEFVEDLKDHERLKGPGLYLGSLIFNTLDERETPVQIVDGQQRLTTIFLLLIACRRRAMQLGNMQVASLTQQNIGFVSRTTGQDLGPRLIASRSIRDLFQIMSEIKWDGEFPLKIGAKSIKRQVNRIKPIYDFFAEKVKSFNQPQLSDFLEAIYNTYVIRIDIENELEAFSIFERTNARGLDLEVSDLLKNYLFSNKVENLKDSWNEIIENSGGTILRMLKYYYVSKNGYTQKSSLYRKLKSEGQAIGPAKLVEELGDFSKYYNVMKTADKEGLKNYFDSTGCTAVSSDQYKYENIYYSLEGLRLFKISQMYPLVYSALSCFKRTGCGANASAAKNLMLLFDGLEKYHFINNAICDRIGNEVEMLYADHSDLYSKSNDFEATTREFMRQLKEKVAKEEEFVSRFEDVEYSPDTIPLIAYIFDRLNNVGLKPSDRVAIYNSDPKVLRKNHNIEHFYPQKPEPEMKSDPETLSMVHNIGNLLALGFTTNSKLGNLSPTKKIDKLKGPLKREIQNKVYIEEFIDKYEKQAATWDYRKIQFRASELAEEAYSLIWKIK